MDAGAEGEGEGELGGRTTTGTDMKTTIIAENAAVAVKISTLVEVPWVRKMRPTAKMAEKPARQSNRSLSLWSWDNTVMATTGNKHATTVENPDVIRNTLFSDQVSIVLRFST